MADANFYDYLWNSRKLVTAMDIMSEAPMPHRSKETRFVRLTVAEQLEHSSHARISINSGLH